MSLPLNTTPVYTLTIPSTQKEYKYRPFLVKDQKALMIAQQSDDPQIMFDTLKSLIASCAKNQIDVDKLATFDVEYIFLQLRAISQGELSTMMFKCSEDHGDEQNKAVAKVTVDIRDAKVERFKNHTNKIELSETTGIVLRYPTLDVLKKIKTVKTFNYDDVFNIAVNCIEYIYSGSEIHSNEDYSQTELVEWLNTLTAKQFDQIQQFFKTMPKVRLYVDYECPLCHKKYHKYMEGISSFF